MGWLDVAVAVLALLPFVVGTLWWMRTSFAGETLSRWRERRRE
jgi:heme exporter protein D